MMKDTKVTKVTITKDGKYIYSGDQPSTIGHKLVSDEEHERLRKLGVYGCIINPDEPINMEIETFKSKFKRIKKCAYSLFDNNNDSVEFIYDYLNNGFKKTCIYQGLSQAAKCEYDYLASDIQHVWDNLNIL